MPADICPLWLAPPPDLPEQLGRAIEKGLAARSQGAEPEVFFRADDVGPTDANLTRLLGLFLSRRLPLAAAVVPDWIDERRWEELHRLIKDAPELWCWHQHGYDHRNHEPEGRKQEFGPSRTAAEIEADLTAGRQRLERILGPDFTPIFTPPWNRCDDKTLELLKRLGYDAVSRRIGSKPLAPDGLPDFQISVDLHTRKESDPIISGRNICLEIETSLSKGRLGFMIHHQRMNDAAFVFMKQLFEALKTAGLRPVDIRRLK